MIYEDSAGVESTGTTDDQDETDNCACSALMPCYEHYLTDRGRPAIRRRTEGDD